jgi:hypothetical protein
MTINADILRAVGLVRDVKKPLKVLGNGELSTALFVVADAFTKSATAKIEAAGGSVNVLEVPVESRPALGVDDSASGATDAAPASAEASRKAGKTPKAEGAPKAAKAAARAEAPADATAAPDAEPADDPGSTDADAPADVPDAIADETPATADAAAGTDEVSTDSTDESA